MTAPPDDPLATRLGWITILRVGFLTLLLGATALLYLGGELSAYPFSRRVVLYVIGAAYVLAAAYAFILRRRQRLRELAYAQIVFDQLTWTALVYVSGGATSGATSFYALTCLVGAILIGVRGSIAALAAGLTFYWTLCAGFYLGSIVPPADQPFASYASHLSTLTYPLLVNGLGILVVALLAGYLAERLRIAGGELEAAQGRAREAERLAELGRIAAWLAHEIRNPLGSISGSIELLRESPEMSEEDRQLCGIVRREVARLNDLVSDMLDLSKPRAPVPRRVDLAEVARDVVALARGSAQDGSVEVTYDGPREGAVARCDEAQMRQVLWNLVRNAVQASPEGARVRVGISAREASLELRVEDSGPGIPEEARERIFDAFYTRRAHGAGIGLAVVKRIVDDHAPLGASITVANLEPRGAVFRVELPAQPASPAPVTRSIPPRASLAPGASERKG